MKSLPIGYKLRNGYFEKTITFVRGRLGGKENVITETVVRDSSGRLVSVFQERPTSSKPSHQD